MERIEYEECKIEVIVFDGQDVIVTSPGDCDFETDPLSGVV